MHRFRDSACRCAVLGYPLIPEIPFGPAITPAAPHALLWRRPAPPRRPRPSARHRRLPGRLRTAQSAGPLRARAAPVADAHRPALLLLYEKAAPTQKPGGYGTGRQWRPLDQALAVLWQAAAWREELIQLLELLAERADRRLHPLPWALPVPLCVHGHHRRLPHRPAHHPPRCARLPGAPLPLRGSLRLRARTPQTGRPPRRPHRTVRVSGLVAPPRWPAAR